MAKKSYTKRDYILDTNTGVMIKFRRIKGRSLKNLFGKFGYLYNKRFPSNWRTFKMKEYKCP